MSLHSGFKDVGNVFTLLLGNGCDARQRLAIPSGGERRVTDHKDIRMTRNRQIRGHFHPSCAIGVDVKPSAGRRRHDPGCPHDRTRLDALFPEEDRGATATGHCRTQPYLDAELVQ